MTIESPFSNIRNQALYVISHGSSLFPTLPMFIDISIGMPAAVYRQTGFRYSTQLTMSLYDKNRGMSLISDRVNR